MTSLLDEHIASVNEPGSQCLFYFTPKSDKGQTVKQVYKTCGKATGLKPRRSVDHLLRVPVHRAGTVRAVSGNAMQSDQRTLLNSPEAGVTLLTNPEVAVSKEA